MPSGGSEFLRRTGAGLAASVVLGVLVGFISPQYRAETLRQEARAFDRHSGDATDEGGGRNELG